MSRARWRSKYPGALFRKYLSNPKKLQNMTSDFRIPMKISTIWVFYSRAGLNIFLICCSYPQTVLNFIYFKNSLHLSNWVFTHYRYQKKHTHKKTKPFKTLLMSLLVKQLMTNSDCDYERNMAGVSIALLQLIRLISRPHRQQREFHFWII